MQCEILQHEKLGNDPPNEEQVPLHAGNEPPLFDFFGLGQQVLTPIAAHDPIANIGENLDAQIGENDQG